MLIGLISRQHGLPSALVDAASEVLVGVCELRGKLSHFATMNGRFAAIVSRSSPQDWLKYGEILGEVNGVEQKIDGWIALVKTDEFNEGDCARGLGSLVAQYEHLVDTTFRRPELDLAEQQLGLANSFDYDLDNFAAAVGFARQAVRGVAGEDGWYLIQSAIITKDCIQTSRSMQTSHRLQR